MRYRHFRCTPKYSEIEKLYYGIVEGVPEIPVIEADEIHDFERMFHEAVDRYLYDKRQSKPKGKGGLVALVSLIAILAVMVLTCPKKEQHVSVLTDNISYALRSSQSSNKDDANVLGELLGTALAKPLINSYLTVNDYILFSVGHLTYQGEDRVVSFGAFGHIFTMSKEELKRRME